MFLERVEVYNRVVLELARLVDDLATKLRNALANKVHVLALEPDERDEILRALEDPPDGLESPRATLLQQAVWRQREGLS